MLLRRRTETKPVEKAPTHNGECWKHLSCRDAATLYLRGKQAAENCP